MSENENRILKLRGASRYMVLSVGKEKDPVTRNGTVEVDQETAEGLLKQVVYDRANTAWPVWEDVTTEGAAKVEKEAVKKTTRRRRRKAQEPAESDA